MTKPGMDGERVRQFLNAEVDSLLATYEQFAHLLPNPQTDGAEHRGEDGRYIEALVRGYLRKLLPTSLEVASGFILRPAVKTGIQGRERSGSKDSHSDQLDILIFDSTKCPVFARFEDAVIVPPEGVVAIISVKKHLRSADIERECKALAKAARLCQCLDAQDHPMRGPFLSLMGMKVVGAPKRKSLGKWVFDRIKSSFANGDSTPTFDQVVGHVGALDDFSVFKKRPSKACTNAEFIEIVHQDGESHLGLQMILTGILSVYYDPSRTNVRRPGFSGFQPGRPHDSDLGVIPVSALR